LLAGAAALAAPRIAAAQDARVLKFVPQADLAVLDPIWTTAEVTRNHAMLVYDTLYGRGDKLQPVPQMAEGVVSDADDKVWTFRLREGLRFHDNEPVLGRDVVASLARWGKRDGFGQVLFGLVDELSAPSDREVVFRLKRGFPLILEALSKVASNVPVIMPERLAKTDASTQVAEMIGSGPYRFKADERVPGVRAVYEKFAGYRPREGGPVTWTSGPKVAHFERVEWITQPDPSTAAAALQRGEVDWWEWPSADLLPLLARDRGVAVAAPDRLGNVALMRMNHLQPPFDNPAIRRAMLGAVSQEDYMLAISGTDRSLWQTGMGYFAPGSPMASDVGMAALNAPRDMEKVKRDLKAAGYNNEPVVLLGANDLAVVKASADVGNDMMTRAGLNVDYVATDWGTVVQRRAKKDPPSQGGWNVFFTGTRAMDQLNPAGHIALRSNGADAWPGWPSSARMEELRQEWFFSRDAADQNRIGREMQRLAFEEVPYIPLGLYLTPTAYRRSLQGMVDGIPVFWNIRRAS
jgi:peptide/nickel transport system substrate-binding protein